MGRVTCEAIIENPEDLWAVKKQLIPASMARRVVVPDALIDTGATLLSLPKSLIQQLGLEKVVDKRVKTSAGDVIAGMYSAVKLTIQGRTCTMDVMEVPDSVPVLIGYIPLEHLDFVVDPKAQKLIGNPAHEGIHTYEMY